MELSMEPAQVWGSPEVSDDVKLVANIGLDLDESSKILPVCKLSERNVIGWFLLET